MKKQLSILVSILLLSSVTLAASNDLGASSFSSWIKMMGNVLCPIGLMVSGLLIIKNKRDGAEHLSGTLMGTFVFCGAGSIYALISGFTR